MSSPTLLSRQHWYASHGGPQSVRFNLCQIRQPFASSTSLLPPCHHLPVPAEYFRLVLYEEKGA